MLPARAIQNQEPGGLDACFSCALVTAMEARSPAVPALSPAFHFHNVSMGETITGMTPGDAFGSLGNYGIASAAAHVFRNFPHTSCDLNLLGIRETPCPEAEADAVPRKLLMRLRFGGSGYVEALRSTEGMKQFLLDQAPVVIVIFPNTAYHEMGPDSHATLPRPFKLAEHTPGSSAHAVCVIGFLESERCFVVQDSHGVEFGAQGQWLLPYEAAESNFLDSSIFGIYSAPL